MRLRIPAETQTLDADQFQANFDAIVENVEKVVKGKREVIQLALIAVLAEGHILFEDVPGTGKSVLARALSQSISASASRIQCTPDMLPGDITGSTIFDPGTGKFDFRPGPIFVNILLADEVNRATPKTQSALLEAMAERRVSIDGTTHPLPRPFIVLATQNPIELAGTFALPEAQLDRFLFKITIGYLDRADEVAVMFDNSLEMSIDSLGGVVDPETVNQMIEYATTVRVAPEIGYYIVDAVHATRSDPAVSIGGSPRAAIALLRAARVLAAADGREYVYPDDVRAVMVPVLAHRMVLLPDAVLRGETVDTVVERVADRVTAPLDSPQRYPRIVS